MTHLSFCLMDQILLHSKIMQASYLIQKGDLYCKEAPCHRSFCFIETGPDSRSLAADISFYRPNLLFFLYNQQSAYFLLFLHVGHGLFRVKPSSPPVDSLHSPFCLHPEMWSSPSCNSQVFWFEPFNSGPPVPVNFAGVSFLNQDFLEAYLIVWKSWRPSLLWYRKTLT